IYFADGPRGYYFQSWQCEKYPSLFINVTGSRKDSGVVRQYFVGKPNHSVISSDSLEKAIPTAKKYEGYKYDPYDVRPRDVSDSSDRRDHRNSRSDSRRPKTRSTRSSGLVHRPGSSTRNQKHGDTSLVGSAGPRRKIRCIRRKSTTT